MKKPLDREPTLRKVMVSAYQHQPNGTWLVVEKGIAEFHQFGTDYEEFENGPGNFTTAIVEWPDGSVESVIVEHIRFIKE